MKFYLILEVDGDFEGSPTREKVELRKGEYSRLFEEYILKRQEV